MSLILESRRKIHRQRCHRRDYQSLRHDDEQASPSPGRPRHARPISHLLTRLPEAADWVERRTHEDLRRVSVLELLSCLFLHYLTMIFFTPVLFSTQGTLIATLSGHTSWILDVAYSPDNEHFVSSSADHTVKVWNVQTKQCLHTFTDHSDQVWGVCYNPEGNKVVSVSEDKNILIYDIPV